ncbi:hypothetical protein F7725_012482 [Dissostichus mawsoni]|uniref:Uncharacterized protein n=1 Tax=Dissostichus mawsoni TaxID=36200 RepID=A0A7J5YMV4_DISMA|nr:hypothetical protein F7725_012482 [Dissostichus mawsoni]
MTPKGSSFLRTVMLTSRRLPRRLGGVLWLLSTTEKVSSSCTPSGLATSATTTSLSPGLNSRMPVAPHDGVSHQLFQQLALGSDHVQLHRLTLLVHCKACSLHPAGEEWEGERAAVLIRATDEPPPPKPQTHTYLQKTNAEMG